VEFGILHCVGRFTVNILDIFSGDWRWMCFWSLVGHVSLNFLENLSDVSLWLFSIIYRLPHGEYCRHFADIFPGLSWWIISTLCRAFHCECSPCIFGRLTINYLDIFSELSPWIVPISWHASLLNCPRNFPGDSLWISSGVLRLVIRINCGVS